MIQYPNIWVYGKDDTKMGSSSYYPNTPHLQEITFLFGDFYTKLHNIFQ